MSDSDHSPLPFVFSHGADYIQIAQIHGRSRLHIQKWRALRAVAMRLADAVIVQNSSMAVRLAGEYQGANIRCIPNWVDTDTFSRWTPPNDDTRTVLYVGRLVKEKNLEALAWACRQQKVRLLCVGEGPLKQTLLGLKAECVGAVPWSALPNYHRIATVFAMVSHTEGHCKALAEAMASGLPCVVSKTVTEGMVAGVNCLQVDPTETGIALALGVLIADHGFAQKLGAMARMTAVQKWGKAVILSKERQLLTEIAR